MLDEQQVNKWNDCLLEQGKEILQSLRTNIDRTVDDGDEMKRRLSVKLRLLFGEAEAIRFTMIRRDILRDYGAGRGYEVLGGNLRKKSDNKSTGPERQESRWFRNYFENGGLQDLADHVVDCRADLEAEFLADRALEELRLGLDGASVRF